MCAIPVLFPSVRVDEPAAAHGWYVDGGLRLNAPLKPALALGADALVVVAGHPTAHAPAVVPDRPAEQPELDDVVSQALDGLLADRMVEDLATLGKVNQLLGAGGSRTGGGVGAGTPGCRSWPSRPPSARPSATSPSAPTPGVFARPPVE